MASKTYPSTLSGLRSRVYNRCLAASTAKHSATDDKIRAAINDAQREIQNELLLAFHSRYFMKTDDGVSPVKNRIELPDDFKRPAGLDKSTGEMWTEVDLIPASHYERYRVRDFPQQTGALLYEREPWALIHNHYEFLGAGSVTGTYRHRYWYNIPDLQSDDDLTEIPEDYQEMLVDWAAYMMEEDAGNVERADRHLMRYEKRKVGMRRTSKQMALTEKRRIRNVRNRGGL